MYSLSPEEDETHWMVFDRRVQRSQRQTEIKLERLDLMSEYYRASFSFFLYDKDKLGI
jgi:hypothetical protein